VVARSLSSKLVVDMSGVRWLGGFVLGLGITLPLLPHNPGLPCPLRTATGVPCPLCGMTTAVKASLRGHMRESISANPFGILLVVFSTVALLIPRWRSTTIPLVIVLSGVLASWTWELHRFGFI
jgi:hypothetical protein